MASKKAQVTIFIIVAIIVIAVVLLLIFLREEIFGTTNLNQQQVPSPESFLDTCIRDKVSEASNLIMSQGGYINPENKHTSSIHCPTSNSCFTSKPCDITNNLFPLIILLYKHNDIFY